MGLLFLVVREVGDGGLEPLFEFFDFILLCEVVWDGVGEPIRHQILVCSDFYLFLFSRFQHLPLLLVRLLVIVI